MGASASDITERFQWTFPIVIAPTDPHRRSMRRRSTSGSPPTKARAGSASAPTSRATIRRPSGLGWADHARPDRRRDLRDGVHARAVSRRWQCHLGWIGRRPRARDARRRQDLDERHAGRPARFTRISLIDASPHDAGTAYLAGNRYQRSDRAPYIYKTSDYGKTWTKIVNGLPATTFRAPFAKTRSARACCSSAPNRLLRLVRRRRLVAAAPTGLPVTPVHGIQVKNDDLVIGTHGRAFYVMPNIGVLRQVSRETTNEPVVLFDPADAIRSVSPA